jgi:transposase InsO family protein
VLRTDNGGEFCGNEFEEFCKKCGIARQKTTPYTPQQNGVAERMNRTLMEKARCMLSGAGIGQEFWVGSGYCMLSGQQITLISVG